MVPFSTVRTNNLHPSASTAYVYITNPLNKPSKIHRSLNNFQMNPLPSSPHLLTPFNSDMAKHIPVGGRIWQTTSIRLHSGQTKERFSEWQTHHIICGITFPPYAQHPCPSDFSAHPSGLSKPLRNRRCLHTPVHSEVCACRHRSSLGQSGPCGILHQHRPRQICRILVHAFGLSFAQT